MRDDDDWPSTSRQEEELSPEERAQKMIMEAKAAKTKILSTPGRTQGLNEYHEPIVNQGPLLSPAAVVDENYFVVGAHLDDQMVNKIMKGEYVDFGKLLP